MKRIVSAVLPLLCLLCLILSGCSSNSIEKYVVRDEMGQADHLVLPVSGESATIYSVAEPYLNTVGADELRATEERLTQRLPKNEQGHAFFVSYENDRVCLGAEVIVPIDPPNGEGGGCGIDHDHVFFSEPIEK